MARTSRWVLVALVLALTLGPAASTARAGWDTPLWGWDDDSFSLWPVLFVGNGGFSIPGIQLTDHSFSIPLVHYETDPEDRFDLTPVYHYTEGEEGFALGPRRASFNDGLNGVVDMTYDLLTLGGNARQYLADDEPGYQSYRDYGVAEQILPGEPYGGREAVSLEGKVESAPVEAEAPPPLEDEVSKVPAAEEDEAMKSETPEERSFEETKDPEAGPEMM
ncbi:MAG: hypothetical protein Q8R92_04900 [Deltaproteobacteria bacterium]|nr:hypothetical protein [Deltaproteobacteria bacterium]